MSDCRREFFPIDRLKIRYIGSEDVETSESAVSRIVHFAEEEKLAREGVKAQLSFPENAIVAKGKANGVDR